LIYMYYGNSSATSVSDVEKVLDFYDNFSTGLDPQKWTVSRVSAGDIAAVSNGELNVKQDGSAPIAYVVTSNAMKGDLIVEYKAKVASLTPGHNLGLGIADGLGTSAENPANGFWPYFAQNNVPGNYVFNLFKFEAGAYTILETAGNYAIGQFNKYKIITNNSFYSFYQDGIQTGGTYYLENVGFNKRIAMTRPDFGAIDQGDQYFDDISVRKYSAIEPTVGFGKATSIKNWFDDEWKQRANISIDNSGNSEELTDYQVKIEVPYIQNMQSDFDDLRFSADKVTEIPYWIEEKKEAESATVWIKVPKVEANEKKTVYMYYANPNVSTASNGTDVFEAYNIDGIQGFWNMDEEAFRANLQANPSFENGYDNWNNLNGATFNSTNVPDLPDVAYSGTKILQVEPPADTVSFAQDYPLSLKKGDKYTYSIYVRSRDGQKISGKIAIHGILGTNPQTSQK
ncbi:hypothetical protein LCGC14_2631450, partial [marine sediment metagenome]